MAWELGNCHLLMPLEGLESLGAQCVLVIRPRWHSRRQHTTWTDEYAEETFLIASASVAGFWSRIATALLCDWLLFCSLSWFFCSPVPSLCSHLCPRFLVCECKTSHGDCYLLFCLCVKLSFEWAVVLWWGSYCQSLLNARCWKVQLWLGGIKRGFDLLSWR